jgi:hypothetical protein
MRVRYVPPAGIEPTISYSVGRRLIYWATGAEPAVFSWPWLDTHEGCLTLFLKKKLKSNEKKEGKIQLRAFLLLYIGDNEKKEGKKIKCSFRAFLL